ncbi:MULTISPECIES: cation:proton antiporter [unclassified Imperialibacter]|uniref:cation:proton antiporter n=1 Tax=unclassified Imperialibacter TaxID=2629706 RepID=UPI0012538139|nr:MULTISPECIES: cation:proton antiporter [unclassified Imperialibacter]CAD5270833.1 KefB-and KefC-like glutathione-regulated potassium-efflux system protein [Imperialibacter sp. 89]CAD5298452.1 KefB-and KefC-like glutathione-regulated potassium-efflux system protein [Imperialibacter sp. 75]VVT34919.1 KefB-and KefC-like glutathione-regulated potassium-efflux system protein [Imperialibacter sp. EC-SDR9]
MQIPILTEIVIILGISVLMILIFNRFKLPSILGLLATGMVAGPHGMGLIQASHEVEMLSEIGVIFLLFVIGVEFSFKHLTSIRKTVFVGGTVQVAGTILVTFGIVYMFGLSFRESIFAGFLVSLSSTAIVLKLLQEKGEINTPHGRIALGILIFQDIIVVPMILFTPIIAGKTGNIGETILILLLKVVAVVGLVLIMARYIVPKLLFRVAQAKSRELFILTIIVICFATAWLTSSIGLSLALGAFFAGLIISESDYSHQATANILPFREIFISFFFVSIGMLLDLKFLFDHLSVVLLLTFLTLFGKALIAGFGAVLLRYPFRTVILSGLMLCQVGEFAFLLSATGIENQILSPLTYQYFLSVSLITMGLTPFILSYASKITDVVHSKTPNPLVRKIQALSSDVETEEPDEHELKDHLVIIGYGINGKNVAKAARKAAIPYAIVEMNPATVKQEKERGEPIMYGDASDDVILRHVQIQSARVVVIAISDPSSTKRIVAKIREFSNTVHIIVRTRYINEIEESKKLGADEVIPEEFETSIEIFTRVLRHYLVPLNEIEAFTQEVRSGSYEMLRSPLMRTEQAAKNLSIQDLEMACVVLEREDKSIVGKSIAESRIKSRYKLFILAIQRGQELLTDIDGDTEIKLDDRLYVFGKPGNILKLNQKVKA